MLVSSVGLMCVASLRSAWSCPAYVLLVCARHKVLTPTYVGEWWGEACVLPAQMRGSVCVVVAVAGTTCVCCGNHCTSAQFRMKCLETLWLCFHN